MYFNVGPLQPYMTNHQIFVVHIFRKKKTKRNKQNKNKLTFKNSAICFVFAFVLFFFTTSALMRTFTRQQYLLYAPRKKRKKQNEQSRK